MSAICNFQITPPQKGNILINNVDLQNQREKISHCRFCAKEKKCVELLDLTVDHETSELYLSILLFFQMDFVDFSIENIPKTTCESCYIMIQKSYSFFLNVKQSQIVLTNLYCVKKEHEHDNMVKTECIDTKLNIVDDPEDNMFSDPTLRNTKEISTDNREEIFADILNISYEPETPVDQSVAEYDTNKESEDSDEDIADIPIYNKLIKTKTSPIKTSPNNMCIEDLMSKCQNVNDGSEYIVDTAHRKIDCMSFPSKMDSKLMYSGFPVFLEKDDNDEQILDKTNNESLINKPIVDSKNVSKIIEDSVNKLQANKDDCIPLPSKTDITLTYGGVPVFLEEIGDDDDKFVIKTLDDDHSWNSYPWTCKHCRVEFDTMEDLRLHGLHLHQKCYAFKCVDCDLDMFNMFNSFIEHVRQHFDELRYYCPHCNVRFDSISECTKHVLSHWSDGQRICEWCGEICKDGDALKLHKSSSRKIGLTKKVNHQKPHVVTTSRKYKGIPIMLDEPASGTWDDYQWACQDCSLRLPSVQSLREHTQQLHGKCFSMKCADCLRVFSYYSKFASHVAEHRPYLKNYCIYCNEHIKDANQLKTHVVAHCTSAQRPCDACGQTFESKQLEAQHFEQFQPSRRRIYMTTEDLTCDICKSVLTNMSTLRSHKKLHHENRKRDHVCHLCGAQFYVQYLLERHIVAQHGDEKHICKVCNKNFRTKFHLKVHVKTVHIEAKKMICDYCSKEFTKKLTLKEHILRHIKKDKKHKCQICSKLYVSVSGLKIHMNIHTGARPYSCQNCDKTFTNWANCNKHMLRIHGTTLCKTKLTKHGRVPIDDVHKVKNITTDVKHWVEDLTKKKIAKRKRTRIRT